MSATHGIMVIGSRRRQQVREPQHGQIEFAEGVGQSWSFAVARYYTGIRFDVIPFLAPFRVYKLFLSEVPKSPYL
jgi:hypothetical protein